jgi:two-component system chemotaxis response regulator CheB
LRLENGVFANFSEGTLCFAFSLQPNTHADIQLELRSALEAALKRVGTRTRYTACKLIGHPLLLRQCKDILSKAGVRVERAIERNSSFDVIYNADTGRVRLAKTPENTKKSANLEKKIRVAIIDDSATIRKLLGSFIAETSDMELLGTAENEQELRTLVSRAPPPDVVTLDLNMPQKPGIALLQEILVPLRIPAVIVSTLSIEEGPSVLAALDAGAIDYVQKPSLAEVGLLKETLLEKLRGASKAKMQIDGTDLTPVASAQTSDRVRKKFGLGRSRLERAPPSALELPFENQLIAIGASTGGTDAIRKILMALPEEIPPIVIVQHIPGGFSKAFAERLNSSLPFAVLEAQDGVVVEPGMVLVAPGGYQMRLEQIGNRLLTRIEDTPPVNRHKPSVDTLFHSVAELRGLDRLGMVLTGMGNDGAAGLLALRNSGAYTVAQDETSSVVFGMPKEAIRMNAADRIAPLHVMPGLMLQWSADRLAHRKNPKAS